MLSGVTGMLYERWAAWSGELHLVKKYFAFVVSEDTLPCSKRPIIFTHPETDKQNVYTTTLPSPLTSSLILSSSMPMSTHLWHSFKSSEQHLLLLPLLLLLLLWLVLFINTFLCMECSSCQYFRLFWYFADRASQYIYLNIKQLDALNFIMSLFHASTCFEHTCSSSGGQNFTIRHPVTLHLYVAVRCTERPPICVMIPDAV